jgi:hypothetical protein
MRIFGREPALFIAIISAAVSLIVTFNVGLSSEQAGAIVAVISALSAAATAAVTRPIAPAAFTGVVSAVAALLSAYGLHLSPGTIGAANGLVLAVLALLTRGQVSPTKSPFPRAKQPQQTAAEG